MYWLTISKYTLKKKTSENKYEKIANQIANIKIVHIKIFNF